jgi:hypothetical protein
VRRTARLSGAQADAGSDRHRIAIGHDIESAEISRGGAAELRCSRAHHGIDMTSRSERIRTLLAAARPRCCAAAALRHNVALCAPSRGHGACGASSPRLSRARAAPTRRCSLRCASPHNTRYVGGRRSLRSPVALGCCARSRACIRTHALRASVRVLRTRIGCGVLFAWRVGCYRGFVIAPATR